MRAKRKTKTAKTVATVSALCPTPRAELRWAPVSRITFNPRTTPLSAEELAGLEIPAFLKR